MIESQIHEKIRAHKLPPTFVDTIRRWYIPIAERLAQQVKGQNQCLVVGVQGCQGSGKSTLADFLKTILEIRFDYTTAVLSIDDFYLTKQERLRLGNHVHPLLVTRGVPGTHDVELAIDTIDKLGALREGQRMRIPRFDKASDDRADPSAWDSIGGPVKIVVMEGWCVGLTAQPEHALHTCVNNLEKEQDSDARWRRFVNTKLANEYQRLFGKLQHLVVLKAPSFRCVYQWRLLQEQKLGDKLRAGKAPSGDQIMTPDRIRHFISHYQRLTEHALNSLPAKADWVLTLAEDHSITDLRSKYGIALEN